MNKKFSKENSIISNTNSQQVSVSNSSQSFNPSSCNKHCESLASVKSRKSSNIIATFVKKARHRKKVKSANNASENINENPNSVFSDKSYCSLGFSHTDDEVEINVENYDSKDSAYNVAQNKAEIKKVPSQQSNLATSLTRPSFPAHGKVNFLRRLIGKQTSSENINKKDVAKLNSTENVRHKLSRTIFSNTKCNQCCNFEKDEVVTTFIKFDNSFLNITLANALQVVQEIAANLHDSEMNVVELIMKFIKNDCFKKDLIDTVSSHSKLKWEVERRTSALGNDMWLQQIEITRSQERALQDTLNSIVKQNRQLQIDNEIIYRRHEKLVKKLRSFQDINPKSKFGEYDEQIDKLLKHNEGLQQKLEKYFHQIEGLEQEVQLLQKQNDSLEEQLRVAANQMQNMRGLLHRNKTNYELEITALEHNLEQKEKLLKEVVDAGDILLEDIDSMKRQFEKFTRCNINWMKFKDRGNCVTDLIYVCRSCINELAKEIVDANGELALKEKDLETLTETCNRLRENLQRSSTEVNDLSRKINENQKLAIEEKCKQLEDELKRSNEKMLETRTTCELEKKALHQQINQYESLAEELKEKERMLEQTKLFMTNIASENYALRNQVEGLNRMLRENGAGDVSKELANIQEQAKYFHNQYCILQNEKEHLINEVASLKTENTVLIDHQEANLKHLQAQEKELEKLNAENNALKQQLESERQTVNSLQTERMKYLEEKNVLRTVFQQMKSEAAKVPKLEGTVADISKEANRLAMIAEYNKQMGERLKSEVVEKEETICKLQENVDELNNLQLKNTQEKLSLCYELSELSNVKNELRNVLKREVKKNAILDDTATTQIKKYEHMQKTERAALMELLRDFKIVVEERDNFLKEQEQLKRDMTELKVNYSQLTKQLDSANYSLNEKDVKLKKLLYKHEEDKNLIKKLDEQLTALSTESEANSLRLETQIEQFKKQIGELESGIQFLQTNSKNLQKELDETREKEKDASDMAKRVIAEKVQMQNTLESCQVESQKLKQEIAELNNFCEKILNEYEENLKNNTAKEKELCSKIENLEAESQIQKQELEQFRNDIKIKNEEIYKNRELIQDMEQKLSERARIIKEHSEQNMIITRINEQNHNLEQKLEDIEEQCNDFKFKYKLSQAEIIQLQNKLSSIINKDENEINTLNYHIRELSEVNMNLNEECKSLKVQLSEALEKLDNEHKNFRSLSQMHKDLSAQYLKCAGKLKRLYRPDLQTFENLSEKIKNLHYEKNNLEDKVKHLQEEMNAFGVENGTILSKFDNLLSKYKNICDKCNLYEESLKALKESFGNYVAGSREGNEKMRNMKSELQEKQEVIVQLKKDLLVLQQRVTSLDLEKSELSLRLHEIQAKLTTELDLNEELKNTQKLILAAIVEMKQSGKVEPDDCNHLLMMVRSDTEFIMDEIQKTPNQCTNTCVYN